LRRIWGKRRGNIQYFSMDYFKVRPATTADFTAWKELAREVEPLFQGPMAENHELHEKILDSIAGGDVFSAVERKSNQIAGMIVISRVKNKIAWLAVFQQYRIKGAGDLLLKRALDELDAAREVEVVTFREDSVEGLPARRLYQKHGFKDFDTNFLYNGYARCLMKRPPV
jgi:ribosomal protein S18 acetylase RimI-like enzyme